MPFRVVNKAVFNLFILFFPENPVRRLNMTI